MQGREHLGVGIVATGAVLWGARALGLPLEPAQVAAGVVLAGVGSLAPDIDQPQSMISNGIPATMFVVGVLMAGGPPVARMLAAKNDVWSAVFSGLWEAAAPLIPLGLLLIVMALAMVSASRVARAQFKHRGEMHSLTLAGVGIIPGLLLCAVLRLPVWAGLLFGLGWASHLLADATTPAGLDHLFWTFRAPGAVLSRGLAAGLLGLLMIFGLIGWVQSSSAILGALPHSSAAAPATGNVALARQRLVESSPEIAASLVKPDEPIIAASGANTSYTWERLQKTTDGAVSVKTITLTLDAAGNVVGVDQH